MEMKIEAGSLAELNQWIPHWLSSLSLARGQIVVDQIHGLLKRSARCSGFQTHSSNRTIASPLVFLIGTDSNGQRSAVLAAHSFSVSPVPPSGHLGANATGIGVLGDSATILHAGPWGESLSKESIATSSIDRLQIPQPLVLALDQTLARQGAKFLQWATDAGTDTNAGLSQVCESFGMQPLATLEYLSVALEKLTLENIDRTDRESATQPILELVNLDEQDSNRNSAAFEALVGRTYKDTLDCPALSQFRTASQTLCSYRDVDSYAPNRWYFVVSKADPAVPIGCVIMATHGGGNGEDQTKTDAVPTSELVYMALLPEKRRQGLGRPLVKLALSEPAVHFRSQISGVSHSPQIVLAVDQQNSHARQLYHDAGLRPLLQEQVWGKSVGDTLSTTT
ncbi:hypothetical protein LF1_03810 [Rubripirellula obstinata]|uniref:N-acetyltransferase domain-containing protein n=1 Tax=Rubripirellula obstinata TaxID=406547 RepID=A0A5B1CCD0_9BACT|nr:hypothetical protein [Rubripirellula obstinata]KAA1257891.1 hypothetical protein LF1_03810 [Rubripirellula obstinata]